MCAQSAVPTVSALNNSAFLQQCSVNNVPYDNGRIQPCPGTAPAHCIRWRDHDPGGCCADSGGFSYGCVTSMSIEITLNIKAAHMCNCQRTPEVQLSGLDYDFTRWPAHYYLHIWHIS